MQSSFRRILFTVFYVLPSGVINDDDDKPLTGHTVRICHQPASYSQKWLTDMMLNENPLFVRSKH